MATVTITRRRAVAAGLIVATGLLVAACGGGGTSSDATAQAGGSPGDPSKATRTVEIRAGDDLRFQPDTVTAKVGETVTFRVINVAKVEHDFVLGDEKAQAAHEKEMQDMAADPNHNMAAMGDEPNAIHIAPGATKEAGID